MKKNPIKLMMLSLVAILSITLFACSSPQPKPTFSDVQARLLSVQSDLAAIAASPATQTAIDVEVAVAGIAETAVGAPELVPETVKAAAALKAVNAAIAAGSGKLPVSTPAPVPITTAPLAPSPLTVPSLPSAPNP